MGTQNLHAIVNICRLPPSRPGGYRPCPAPVVGDRPPHLVVMAVGGVSQPSSQESFVPPATCRWPRIRSIEAACGGRRIFDTSRIITRCCATGKKVEMLVH